MALRHRAASPRPQLLPPPLPLPTPRLGTPHPLLGGHHELLVYAKTEKGEEHPPPTADHHHPSPPNTDLPPSPPPPNAAYIVDLWAHLLAARAEARTLFNALYDLPYPQPDKHNRILSMESNVDFIKGLLEEALDHTDTRAA
jgi:hypothetical protein